eukprot:TRINITY_DN778206_c0_g1_i1.p1 TRINITY_DN778206_c0_g1~~TRINITY_DN778206_c0_g1_i1.p1  ORF type:complete len:150 (+),score=24.71 TRINITY_DN778206_c0_g1_i1:46-495(+)
MSEFKDNKDLFNYLKKIALDLLDKSLLRENPLDSFVELELEVRKWEVRISNIRTLRFKAKETLYELKLKKQALDSDVKRAVKWHIPSQKESHDKYEQLKVRQEVCNGQVKVAKKEVLETGDKWITDHEIHTIEDMLARASTICVVNMNV